MTSKSTVWLALARFSGAFRSTALVCGHPNPFRVGVAFRVDAHGGARPQCRSIAIERGPHLHIRRAVRGRQGIHHLVRIRDLLACAEPQQAGALDGTRLQAPAAQRDAQESQIAAAPGPAPRQTRWPNRYARTPGRAPLRAPGVRPPVSSVVATVAPARRATHARSRLPRATSYIFSNLSRSAALVGWRERIDRLGAGWPAFFVSNSYKPANSS
jgi:hypothetical protein